MGPGEALAQLLALALRTEGLARWRFSIREVDWSEAAAARDREAECAAVNRALEDALAESVADGFWFHERF